MFTPSHVVVLNATTDSDLTLPVVSTSRTPEGALYVQVQWGNGTFEWLKPADFKAVPETVEQFMARKSDPNWKPAPLPKFRKLPRLSEEKFAKLLAEHGGSGIIPMPVGGQKSWGLAA